MIVIITTDAAKAMEAFEKKVIKKDMKPVACI
jgi:hypothetical protein